ncbi:bifunctional 3'-5' exonuclease/DNA polymerase [Microbacterium azadirachtae]|uniref:bifunctional 3'-5' exonuclease/DNA polymerase n=1 Tax=Microbacterium azadirachtae TaxID=582680 RepID=UPI00088A8ABB|nr:bifunctional 3'-5' exonuclease/DNA polymerase [Microbacterium azadirachtae]SDL30808.1 DNA polymerase-1 [Microbacterium azadirachtae]SEF60900.1 DNA polymerase-1 [Microbacterium azadirachtae]SEF61501.1 DNA polymerase-1 [Microbacterium azadirachtae]
MIESAAVHEVVLGRSARSGHWRLLGFGTDGASRGEAEVAADDLHGVLAEIEEAAKPRWVVRSLREVYPPLLAAGIRIRRAHDLLLCHAILRDTASLREPLAASSRWVRADPLTIPISSPGLFDLSDVSASTAAEEPAEIDELLAEYARQREALRRAPDGRLALLCAAESTGALVAEEMTAAGLPWSTAVHEGLLAEALGPRPVPGARPARMAELAVTIATTLEDPSLNPDSPPRLLKSLRRAGILVDSTSRWELGEVEHPVVEPLLAYKKLARLYSANGWQWLSEWVRDERFRPVYLTGGVVTGRWASSGGGALQIPRSLRPAVRADEGWALVCADVAQLEPRVLAAMSKDRAMAAAARGADLYEGVVRSGAVQTRQEAKYAVLGAMYGATTGPSGRLGPRLRSVFPRAMALVDGAARTGEDGGVVSTLLGRSSPRPDAAWTAAQSRASDPEADGADERTARSRARDRGRFTRNFVVQGTAAEWSLLWLAEIRHRLSALPEAAAPATGSGPVFGRRAHLAFFLHDEVIVHTPAELAEEAARAVRESAEAATRRLFPGFEIDIPLDLRIAEDAGKAS